MSANTTRNVLMVVLVAITVFTNARTVCDRTKCPPLTCADPDYSTDACCGSCENSKCKFEGQVKYNAFFPTWYPSTCQSCRCEKGQTVCVNTTCPSLANCESQGYQIKTIDGKCCPVCDYGIAKDSCGLIRVHSHEINVSMDATQSCKAKVVLHECDKKRATIDGKQYRCKATRGERVLQLTDHADKNCRDIRSITFVDNIDCKPDQRLHIFY